jgi:hypothetical protein
MLVESCSQCPAGTASNAYGEVQHNMLTARPRELECDSTLRHSICRLVVDGPGGSSIYLAKLMQMSEQSKSELRQNRYLAETFSVSAV